MENRRSHGVFCVASPTTREKLFSQRLGEWFAQSLIQRTVRALALQQPSLGGRRLKAALEPIRANDGQISGWLVRVWSDDRQPLFQRRWPLRVLHGTALAVRQQLRELLGDDHVLYWVSEPQTDEASDPAPDAIEFDLGGEDQVVVPSMPQFPGTSLGRILCPAAEYPVDVVVVLGNEAYATLAHDIRGGSDANRELAWAGQLKLWRSDDQGVLIYQVQTLARLSAPEATATLCPIGPEELVGLLSVQEPVAFFHTHLLPDRTDGPIHRYLTCSYPDLRAFHRLPIGSLGIIAASRLPLQLRIYGWPADGSDLSELAAMVTLRENPEGVPYGHATPE